MIVGCEGVQRPAACERAGKKGEVGTKEQWPLAPCGHVPLRSLAEGRLFVNFGIVKAARHRGAEEEICERYFYKYFSLLLT
jgi:hypothetical protein